MLVKCQLLLEKVRKKIQLFADCFKEVFTFYKTVRRRATATKERRKDVKGAPSSGRSLSASAEDPVP